jgi:uncharacterized protein (TIGR02145 family)
MKITLSILFVILSFFLFYSCKKVKIVAPVVTTEDVTDITISSAESGGSMNDDPYSVITKGVCYSTQQNPTIADNTIANNSFTSIFQDKITGLSANTTYYARAFATNSAGTGYGDQVKFTTLIDYSGQTGTVTDIDGNTYPTIGIGGQIWMAKNLVTTKFQDGTPIQLVESATSWSSLSTPVFCYYNNSPDNIQIYGGLYNFYTIDSGSNGNKNICPAGWHVPADNEFITLILYLGEGTAAQKLKESGTSHWISPNSGNNSSGFSALPAGVRNPDGSFDEIGSDGLFWSSTTYGNLASRLNISGDVASASDVSEKGNGFSIRCLKN